MKLLIVKLSAFGDIVHSLPALHDLLARPEVDEVHWLVDARYAFVTRIFPSQVKVHMIGLRDAAPVRQAWQACRALRRERFDAVLDLQGLIKSATLARLAGSPVYGMDVRHLRESVSRFLLRPVAFHDAERHVVQQYRRVAAAPFEHQAACASEAMPYSPPQARFDEDMQHQGRDALTEWGLAGKRFVWLHTGGGWETKQLPEAAWVSLASELHAEGRVPVLGWGNERERTAAGRIAKAVPGTLLPERRLDIDALCGVLREAAAVVGPDTGVVHLAAALGTPTVSFWGPSASWRSGPLGPDHRHIESNPHCGPCFKRQCEEFICMDMISPGAIISAIHEVVS